MNSFETYTVWAATLTLLCAVYTILDKLVSMVMSAWKKRSNRKYRGRGPAEMVRIPDDTEFFIERRDQ